MDDYMTDCCGCKSWQDGDDDITICRECWHECDLILIPAEPDIDNSLYTEG